MHFSGVFPFYLKATLISFVIMLQYLKKGGWGWGRRNYAISKQEGKKKKKNANETEVASSKEERGMSGSLFLFFPHLNK